MIILYSFYVSAQVNKVTPHGKAFSIETCKVSAINRDYARVRAIKKFLDEEYAVSVENIKVIRCGQINKRTIII